MTTIPEAPSWETTEARLQLAVDMLADNLDVTFEKDVDHRDGTVMWHCHLDDPFVIIISAMPAEDDERPITIAAHLAYGHTGDVVKEFPSFLLASPTTDYITDTVVEWGRLVERLFA